MTNFSSNQGIFEIIEYGNRPLFKDMPGERGVLFLCVTSGTLKAVGSECEKSVSHGECLTLALGRGCKLIPESDNFSAVYIVADGSLVYDLMRFYGISDFMSAISPDAAEALTEIQRRMLPTGNESDGSGDCATAFHRFLFKLKRASQLGARPGGTAPEIKNYIDSHLEGKLTLEELSKIFFVSKTQIFRIFKQAYGVAPMQYFLKQKVELAKKMLSDGHMKISEIAEALSFTDAKHFSKTFKRFTGELPRNYKRRPSFENEQRNF